MPIPQLKSNFTRRRISDRDSNFHSRPLISDVKIKRENKKRHFLPSFRRKKSGDNYQPKSWRYRFIKKVWPYALGGFLLAAIFTIGLFAYYSKYVPEVGKIMDRSVALSAKIYDRTGEILLYEVHGEENRTLVNVNDVPDYVKQATIAIEDKSFYSHQGISLWGIIRSQIVPRLQGKRAQGGSTLTQQFVKNAILTDERSLSRKIKEWILSYQIEQKYDKDQILGLYLNEIPYGGAVYGVEAAAQYYFGKPVGEITLAEAAVLAALPQGPTKYSPYGNNKDLLIGRQQYILDLMVEQKYISEEDAQIAKGQELVFKKRTENIKAPHFVMYIRELLEQEYGAAAIEQNGWTITTSLDWEAQELAQAAVDEFAPANLEKYEATNASLVSVDVESGEILAMIGSKDYFNDEIDGQVNVALSKRQPGSSMKPLVYLKAFEKGYRPDTVLFDLVTNFSASGKPYEPHNYDLQERGPVTMRQALAGSLNIPAVKTLYLAGVYDVVNLANSFGYTTLTEPDRYGLSLVLGGAEVKLLEHVNAYATFAREGVYKDTVPILEIKDPKGKVIWQKDDNNKGRRVIDKEYVRTLNSILSDNDARAFVFGQSNYLTLPDRPVAAKTGTTNDYHDAWTLGFTPSVATGVWVGNNDNSEMKRGADGSVVAAPIWNKFMREYAKKYEVLGFKTQELEPCDKAMVCGSIGQEFKVKIDKISGKLATEFTPYTQVEEKTYRNVHNILHYVNINDPLGEPLADPTHEPQYNLWEGPVLKWVEEQDYTNEAPPTEYDDIHTPDLQPSITWVDPASDSVINQSSFTMKVAASAPQGVERVEYFIDGEKIGTSYDRPFDFTYTINPFLSNGRHTLKAIAFDGGDNFKEASIDINLDVNTSDRDFNVIWVSPDNGENISVANLPINLQLGVDRPENIKKIDFYYIDPDNKDSWFSYVESPGATINVSWGNSLSPGVYKLYAVVKDRNDNLLTMPAIIVNIE
ncbi:PBP1A family penicillin-binding protein [Candidatus Parcubacteria bacterium]|nr:MAG: PBP1A family penicillin-binding protein [Candidatus Parcubacteria bacterium]